MLNQIPPRTSLPSALIARVGILLGALALVLLPSAALAHDHLISSDPADGAVLETSPTQIHLTFSDTPLDVSPVVKVSAADGTVLAEGAPRVEDTVATMDLPPLPEGPVTVDWRVVSADGHPIEGTLSFTVQAPAAASDGGAASTDQSTSAAPSTSAASTATSPAASSTAAAQDQGGLSGGVLAAIIIPVLLLVALGAWLVLRRRRGTDGR